MRLTACLLVMAFVLCAACSKKPRTGDDPDAGNDTDTETCVDTENEFGDEQLAECADEAPPDSFEPDIQWTWTGPEGEDESAVIPLVANLTDDDDSGTIDLDDIPDVVVVVIGSTAHIYVLDGATGDLHFRIETEVYGKVTPALGDIDDDGLVEIVSANADGELLAFENDGEHKWTGDVCDSAYDHWAITLADLDNDGDVEIIAESSVFDHEGKLLWSAVQGASSHGAATTAADLDGDCDLEVVLGHAAYHHDGTEYFVHNSAEVHRGFPQVADLDDDDEPEILLTNEAGLTVLEHDGAIKYQDLRPTGVSAGGNSWTRPACIHDFDGDGEAEFASSTADLFSVFEADASVVWSAAVSDLTGIAGGTAFDFLGDGTAEAMYADETTMFVFDAEGDVLLEIPRTSGTLTEYPVVADIDNDGSAEIVVVSNDLNDEGELSPTVQVIRDIEDRWIQARRIWNQHTYHVTNVREDGTIPRFEPPSWRYLNTFRTNSQIENDEPCVPVY